MIPNIITPRAITLMLDSRHRQLDVSHPNFTAVRDWLKASGRDPSSQELDSLRELVDIPSFIAKVSEGHVQVADNEVRFDGNQVHGHIADRLLTLMREGFDIRPLMRFLERLHCSPIVTARDELLNWLEKSNLPLTEDGCFIAYKFVSQEYKDDYSRTIDNSIGGTIPRLDPTKVNTNRAQTCAESGYHFCSFGYLGGGHPHVMLVKIAPEDIASFPYESEIAKGRCLWYEVIGEVPADELPYRKVETRPLYDGMYAPSYESDSEGDGDPVYVGVTPGAPQGLADLVKEDAARTTGRQQWLERLKGIDYQGKRLTPKRLMKLIGKVGQRETARVTGIPRSTLQGWID